MNGEAGSPEPEPIEDRIARAIGETLEPFVVSLLAALISPVQCAQGIDTEGDDQRRKAINAGRMLLDETRTRIKQANSFFEGTRSCQRKLSRRNKNSHLRRIGFIST